MTYTVAVDVGGTKIAAGVLDTSKNWLSKVKQKSDTSSADNMYDSLVNSIYEAIKQANLSVSEISGIGVTIPGQLHTETGYAIYQNNLPWTNYPVGQKLTDDFPGKTLAFEHDVVAAALGELAVRNLSDELLVYITVSTGIAASIIHQRKPLRGMGLAGEIGFFPLNDGKTLEEYASGSAMERELHLENLSLVEAFSRWEQGDQRFATFFEERAYQLAVAIFNVTAMLDPNVIILGGGVIANQQRFFNVIKEHYQNLCKHPLQKDWTSRIEQSMLKELSGLYGIAMKANGSV